MSHDFNYFPKARQSNCVIMGWCWIHIPMHSIWVLLSILNESDMDVRTILVGYETSTTPYWSHSSLTAPYWWYINAHPQHMSVANHLLWVWYWCENHCGLGYETWTATFWPHSPAMSHNFNLFQNFGQASVVVAPWWWIHTAIHFIWRLLTILDESDMDVRTILCGYEALTTPYWLHV